MISYYYSKALTATLSEQSFSLPLLRGLTIINSGPYNLKIELDGDIDSDSAVIPVGASIELRATFLTLNYQAVSAGQGGETAGLYLVGLYHEKQ